MATDIYVSEDSLFEAWNSLIEYLKPIAFELSLQMYWVTNAQQIYTFCSQTSRQGQPFGLDLLLLELHPELYSTARRGDLVHLLGPHHLGVYIYDGQRCVNLLHTAEKSIHVTLGGSPPPSFPILQEFDMNHWPWMIQVWLNLSRHTVQYVGYIPAYKKYRSYAYGYFFHQQKFYYFCVLDAPEITNFVSWKSFLYDGYVHRGPNTNDFISPERLAANLNHNDYGGILWRYF